MWYAQAPVCMHVCSENNIWVSVLSYCEDSRDQTQTVGLSGKHLSLPTESLEYIS